MEPQNEGKQVALLWQVSQPPHLYFSSKHLLSGQALSVITLQVCLVPIFILQSTQRPPCTRKESMHKTTNTTIHAQKLHFCCTPEPQVGRLRPPSTSAAWFHSFLYKLGCLSTFDKKKSLQALNLV